MTTAWTRNHVALIGAEPHPTAPLIRRDELKHILPGFDLWDFWPVQDKDGRVAEVANGALFMFLSAPLAADPDARHDHARIRLLHMRGDDWTDLGHVLSDGWAPGSREWAGSAILDRDELTLFFTAAGHRGEARPSADQRLFMTRARLEVTARPRLHDWSSPVELVEPDGEIYQRDLTGGGAMGTIKAFRDPGYFRDPKDGGEYLVFSASLGRSTSDWNGAVGLATRRHGEWRIQAPLITADSVNNELERPHLIYCDGLYYLFWSTQSKVFAADLTAGPNGLYGMVAEQLTGPYRPLNGSGLVFSNPPEAPFQAYSWIVLHDLQVLGFADVVGLDRLPADTAEARRVFGGCPAPALELCLSSHRAWLR